MGIYFCQIHIPNIVKIQSMICQPLSEFPVLSISPCLNSIYGLSALSESPVSLGSQPPVRNIW